MIISHNLSAMNAQRQFKIIAGNQQKSTEKLSSGYRINRSADDATGLAISEKMRRQIRGLNQGSENIQDGISLVQIADGALAEVNDMLHRMTELSVKSANGTNTAVDRAYIQQEIKQLVVEIDRISQTTDFNTLPIFDRQDDGISDGSITQLVQCAAADTGLLTESYQTTDGKYHPAANLDFSTINSRNIKYLYDKSFSFNCSDNCSEVFKFTFRADGTPSSVDNLTAGAKHNYEIDISDCKNGADIVNKLYTYVDANKPHCSKNSGITDGLLVSHSNAMVKEGATQLSIYSYRTYSNAQDAEAFFKNPSNQNGRRGIVDASEITGTVEELDGENHFWIKCSGKDADGIDIVTKRMNSAVLGIRDLNVSTIEGAEEAIGLVRNAGEIISTMRSKFGAYQNRLEHAVATNNNTSENTQAAESKLRDTDMAKEAMRNSNNQILLQAGQAMISQANQQPQGVLSLLS